MSRTRPEIEIDTATTILKAMGERLVELERWWPPSKRGSNAQRCLNAIKEAREAALQCMRDAVN